MKQRGPKPTPTALRKLAGNPGGHPLNDTEPEGIPGSPEMPEHFNAEARKAWVWLCRMLDALGILEKQNLAVMALYCDTWAEYVVIRKDVNKYGTIMVSPKTKMPFVNPYMNVESMLKKQLMGCLTELGLSPSSKSRIHAVEKDEGSEGKTRFFSKGLKVVG